MRNQPLPKITRIAAVLVASMVSATVLAQVAPVRPKLVVGIVVNGLTDDYLQLLRHKFGADGFNRLLNNGLVLTDVEFGTPMDEAAATAAIYTGASPAINGIASATAYDLDKRLAVAALNDPSKIGNYTNETYSPAAIRVSTLGDEVRIDGDGVGQVHSIAPDPAQAIIMSGHAGNSSFWLNDITGQWATTTYYKDVPTPVQDINYRTPLAARLDTMSWVPSLALDAYPCLPKHKQYYAFRYVFPRGDKERYGKFKTSPRVNDEITDIASRYITSMTLGSRDAIDMLNIAYNLQPYSGAKDSDTRLETMDAYLKLDAGLGRLFRTIDKRVGLGNAVIFLAGTPARPAPRRDDPKWALPSGEFSTRRAISLLNVYLMAIYGNGEWVQGYHNGHLYLNRKLIKERDHDIRKMRADAADFLSRMSGVSDVYTIDDITAGRVGINPDATRRNTVAATAGDLVIKVNPGWETVDDSNSPTTRTVHRAMPTAAPFMLLAPDVEARRITVPVDARAIAPTVARVLRIRSPNAAEMAPVR